MKTDLRGRDFINTQDWTREELETVFQLAFDLKMKHGLDIPTELLKNKTLFMMFFFSSTRTRNSFEAGMTQLGGHGQFLEAKTMQISHGDTPTEIGKILSSYGHGIAIRQCDWGVGNDYINAVADKARVPVLNMQCDLYHPFQAMADLMTIMEKKRDLKKKKICMSWAYANSYTKPMSVPHSVGLVCSQFGMDVTLAYPPEFKLKPEIIEQMRRNAEENGSKFEIVHDMDEGFKDADVVYPKSWGCMLETENPDECKNIIEKYKSWICDDRRMALAKKDAIYLHCLPADRGVEVTDSVIDGPQSAVFDEAENRLHVQKAIMALTMGGK